MEEKDELTPYDKFQNELCRELEKNKIMISSLCDAFCFDPDVNCSIPFAEVESKVDSFVYCIQRAQHELNETFLHAIQDLYFHIEEEEKELKNWRDRNEGTHEEENEN